MKKIIALLLALVMVFALCACGETKTEEQPQTEEPQGEEVIVDETTTEEPATEGVMSYAEYAAAEMDSPVVIEAYVQGHQSWWDGKVTVYAQDPDGAYFIYEMTCTEEDAAKLEPGTKIRVTGYKTEWEGEVEIASGSTFEFVEAEPWIAEPVDATAAWGTVDLINYQNQLVIFKDVTVEPYDETGAAFAYKNAEEKTDDLYFKVTIGDTTYDFCVEYYLCGNDTEVYKAVEGLEAGQTVDLVGFLYWYNGPNLHTTAVITK